MKKHGAKRGNVWNGLNGAKRLNVLNEWNAQETKICDTFRQTSVIYGKLVSGR